MFLRDPKGWGYEHKAPKLSRSTSASVAAKQSAVPRSVMSHVRRKVIKISEDYGFGTAHGLASLRRQFETFDESNEGFLDKAKFFRCLKRLGVNLSKSGEKALYRELGEDGRVSYTNFFDFVTDKKEDEASLERKITAAVVAAMGRCSCTYDAFRGSIMAYDETGNGYVTLSDFKSSMQQCGVGGELSEGLVEGIGRRYGVDGSSGVVHYEELLRHVKVAKEEHDEMRRRKKVLKGMEEDWGMVGVMRGPQGEGEAGEPVRGAGYQSFNPFVPEKYKPKHVTTRGKAGKEAKKTPWRGNRGLAPTTIPKKKERVLPKYLRSVESKVKGDLDQLRERRLKAKESRIALAREAVASRRLRRKDEEGVLGEFDGDDAEAGLCRELCAREIAGMYSAVVDDIVRKEGASGDEASDDVCDDDENRGEEKEYWDEVPKQKKVGASESEGGAGKYVVKPHGMLAGWAGDFDFKKKKKSTVTAEEACVDEGGTDIASLIEGTKSKEAEATDVDEAGP